MEGGDREDMMESERIEGVGQVTQSGHQIVALAPISLHICG